MTSAFDIFLGKNVEKIKGSRLVTKFFFGRALNVELC